MVRFNRESSFFDEEKRQKKKSCKKMKTILKTIGGRKGILLTSVLLDKPKYMDL